MTPALLLLSVGTSTAPTAHLDYQVKVDVRTRIAEVSLQLEQTGDALGEITFLGLDERFTEFEGKGLVRDGEEAVWEVPPEGGRISWHVRLEKERDKRAYDARVTPSWAVFRGNDIVPLTRYRKKSSARLNGKVRFALPGAWSIWGPWGKLPDGKAQVLDGPGFPAPRGWMMAGKLTVMQLERAGLRIDLVAPKGDANVLYDRSTFLSMVLPAFTELTKAPVKRLLLVTAGDPMWRGGLSGPGSFYLHADRPLVTEDGTSPILHELFHVASRARSRADADWIVEGLAEWVGLRTLRAAGAVTDQRYASILERNHKRSRKVKGLLRGSSSGDKTRRALYVLEQLDGWMREQTEGTVGLQAVVQLICTGQEAFDTRAFMRMVQEATGKAPDAFFARYDVLPRKKKDEASEEVVATSSKTEDEEVADWSHDDPS